MESSPLEENRINGMILIHKESTFQLRGSVRAIKELLKWLDLENWDNG